MRMISKAFLTGLAAVLPIAVTVYILCWLGRAAETSFGYLIRLAVPEDYYWSGMGFVAGLIVIVLIGFSLKIWVTRKVMRLVEALLDRLPVVKVIYGAARDLIRFFSDSKKRALSEVVLVSVGDGLRQIGLLTREDFTGCPQGMAEPDTVAVYLPNSYELGGTTMLVSRAAVRPLDMSFQDAMRFALTAGLSTGQPTGKSRNDSEDREPGRRT